MGDWVKVKADDGHELGAYVATPATEPIGAVVVVQEIFGVNKSIRKVADDLSDARILSDCSGDFRSIRAERGTWLRRGRFEEGIRVFLSEARIQM